MLLKDLEKIIKIVEKSEIAELEWEHNKERIRIRKDLAGPTSVVSYSMPPPAAAPAAAAPAAAPAAAAPAPKAESRTKEVLSPFVGTFYAAAGPTAAKYTDVGARVKKGDVLCIIEAMKIMNEIEAEFPGKIVSVLVKDGQPVQYGQPLFTVEP
ncbi:MAG: acetyl-CoA carboxylase biotin carboxyl carrier protein [Proteobacteria bacterium]|nr:MAG: acetyl-CoA carboxylase biotin carboxyl carrier protein [Pseudomonadota bacterium]